MNIIKELYFKLCNFKGNVSDHLKKWAGILGLVCLFLIVATIAAIWNKNETIMFYTMLATSMLSLITYFGGKIFAKSLEKISETLPEKIGKPAGEISRELQKIFFPLCTLSLIICFIGFWSAAAGFESITKRDFMVLLAVAVFFSIYGVYTETKTKWMGRVLVPAVIIMLCFYYVKTSHDSVGATIRNKTGIIAAAADRSNLRDAIQNSTTLGIILEETGAYKIVDSAKTLVRHQGITLAAGAAVKVLNPKDEGFDFCGEKYVQIMLPDANGSFGASDTLYVLPGTLDWGESEFIPNKYLLVRASGVEYLMFYTDKPVQISTKNLAGKTVTLSAFEDGELLWNDINRGGMCNVTPGVDRPQFNREVCTFQSIPGFLLKINFS